MRGSKPVTLSDRLDCIDRKVTFGVFVMGTFVGPGTMALFDPTRAGSLGSSPELKLVMSTIGVAAWAAGLIGIYRWRGDDDER